MTPFGPGCPWYAELKRFGPANLKWCEERVCGWVNEPFNTWSNLGYLAAGLWIMNRSARRGSSAGSAFGAIVIVMGALSFLYHASNNFLTQALDFTGMFMMVLFVLAVNARRLGASRRGLAGVYAVSVVLSTLVLWPMHRAGIMIQWTVAAGGAAIAASEYAARRKSGERGGLMYFYAALGTILVAELCSLADATRLVCDPSLPWLQGHSAWHLIGACAMPLIALHYEKHFDRAWARQR